MTIAAAYLISEGVVLGADSTTTISIPTPEGHPGVLQLLHHAQKVFEIGEKSRIGICTWGAGNIGNYSHRTIIAQLDDKVKSGAKVEDVAHELIKIAQPLAKSSNTGFIGYFLGGWDPNTYEPSCFQIELGSKIEKPEPKRFELGLCQFAGMPNIFTRVFRGFDPNFPDNLREELKKRISDEPTKAQFDKIFAEAFEKASLPLTSEGFTNLPIREAIDFVYSYLHITIKATKFKFGAPLCGGPIEIGFITTDRKFRWACHKAFSSAITEQKGGEYHVEE